MNVTESRTPRAREAELTVRQQAFLVAFVTAGTVSGAADASGISRRSHYRWIASDEIYMQAFTDVQEQFVDRIREAVRCRAVDGWLEPVVYQGQIAKDKDGNPVTVRRYSDRLLELLAKAKVPEFKAPTDVNQDFSLSEALDEVERRHQVWLARTQES